MKNTLKALGIFVSSVGILLAVLMTFLFVLYMGYMALVIITFIIIIYVIKTIYDARDSALNRH